MPTPTAIFSLGLLLFFACAAKGGDLAKPLYAELEAKLSDFVAASEQLPQERVARLDRIADAVRQEFEQRQKAEIVFVCTHNSRRSQLAEAWSSLAATYFSVESVRVASGGTETTACNPRTVEALRRAGWRVTTSPRGNNPRVQLAFSPQDPSRKFFSKLYTQAAQGERFVAVMCCADADEHCPVVVGASSRHALHYVDPKIADGTPEEAATYDARSRQIAAEMFYLFRQIARAEAR